MRIVLKLVKWLWLIFSGFIATCCCVGYFYRAKRLGTFNPEVVLEVEEEINKHEVSAEEIFRMKNGKLNRVGF